MGHTDMNMLLFPSRRSEKLRENIVIWHVSTDETICNAFSENRFTVDKQHKNVDFQPIKHYLEHLEFALQLPVCVRHQTLPDSGNNQIRTARDHPSEAIPVLKTLVWFIFTVLGSILVNQVASDASGHCVFQIRCTKTSFFEISKNFIAPCL